VKKTVKDFPLADADRCVACGLCLPHCPTYQLFRNEAESPRGRIAMMQGIASGRLQLDADVAQHLSHCLACRNCEAACPARVPYGSLIDNARRWLVDRTPATPWRNPLRIAKILADADRRDRLARWLRAYRNSGVQRLLRTAGVLPRALQLLDNNLPPLPSSQPLEPDYPPTGPLRGRVSLFTGCSPSLHGDNPVRAGIRLLNRLGYHVHLPTLRQCCGALALHYGDPGEARRQARASLDALFDTEPDAVLSLASGCGAMLQEYDTLLADEPRSGQLVERHADISAFLLNLDWPQDIHFDALPQDVAVHDPCTLRNVLRGGGQVARLLQRIPRIRTVALDTGSSCCGAAGLYGTLHPDTSAQLGLRSAERLIETGAGILVSANMGCALHIAGMARRSGVAIEVLHPVELLARQLDEGTRGE
jgi:glycolate oxidase iron-sulfur subunit